MAEGPQGATESPPADAGSAPADEQVEAELRCKACNKLVTKIFVSVDMLAPSGRQKVVKVGFETRCPRCKEFIYHVFVA